jgi:hypothetical protein
VVSAADPLRSLTQTDSSGQNYLEGKESGKRTEDIVGVFS